MSPKEAAYILKYLMYWKSECVFNATIILLCILPTQMNIVRRVHRFVDDLDGLESYCGTGLCSGNSFCWHNAIGLVKGQSKQVPRILVVINVVFKEHLKRKKLEKFYQKCKTSRSYLRLSWKTLHVIEAYWVTLFPPSKCLNYLNKSWMVLISIKPLESLTSRILKKAIPVRSESDPAWCWGPILLMSSCSATSCKPPTRYKNI